MPASAYAIPGTDAALANIDLWMRCAVMMSGTDPARMGSRDRLDLPESSARHPPRLCRSGPRVRHCAAASVLLCIMMPAEARLEWHFLCPRCLQCLQLCGRPEVHSQRYLAWFSLQFCMLQAPRLPFVLATTCIDTAGDAGSGSQVCGGRVMMMLTSGAGTATRKHPKGSRSKPHELAVGSSR
eukprot:3934135-Rhodomonas_salina.2